jgi:hypothetical protein
MLAKLTYRKLKNEELDHTPKLSIMFLTNVMEADVTRVLTGLGNRRPINQLWISDRSKILCCLEQC